MGPRGRKGMVAGGVDSGGYLKIKVFGKARMSHRLAFLYILGWIPEQVDHIDHVRTNNQWINLRPASNMINGMNQSLSIKNKSGHSGVMWNKAVSKWIAQIKAKDKNIYLGSFDKKDDAIHARKVAENKYGFHPNHGKIK